MAADWDEDSPQLRRNLTELLERLADEADARRPITAAEIKKWHRKTMQGLKVPNPAFVGAFRGEAGTESVQVYIGHHEGTPPPLVAAEVMHFEGKLGRVVEQLDRHFPVGARLDADAIAAVAELAAWAHGEWVRIHPFGNGNGRTARILANVILMRYGLPPALRLRPRPEGGYGAAAFHSMEGKHAAMVAVIVDALRDQTAPP